MIFSCIQHKFCAVTGHYYFSDITKHMFLQTDTDSIGEQFKRMQKHLVGTGCKKLREYPKISVKHTHIHGVNLCPLVKLDHRGRDLNGFSFFFSFFIISSNRPHTRAGQTLLLN